MIRSIAEIAGGGDHTTRPGDKIAAGRCQLHAFGDPFEQTQA